MVNPVPGYRVTTAYKKPGPHWSLGWHTGLDIAAPQGIPIVAGRPGRVIAANAFDRAYGYKVIIEYGDEQDWYCHMPNGSARVRVGQTVTAGQRIGSVGATGNVTGSHLHLERRAAPYTFNASVFRDPNAIINYQEDDVSAQDVWSYPIKDQKGTGDRADDQMVKAADAIRIMLHYVEQIRMEVRDLTARFDDQFPPEG